MGKGGSITEGSRHQPIRSQLVEKLEEEEGEEVWRSNLFVMIYIKTEGRREKREEPQITMEIHNGVKECVEKKKEEKEEEEEVESSGELGGWLPRPRAGPVSARRHPVA